MARPCTNLHTTNHNLEAYKIIVAVFVFLPETLDLKADASGRSSHHPCIAWSLVFPGHDSRPINAFAFDPPLLTTIDSSAADDHPLYFNKVAVYLLVIFVYIIHEVVVLRLI
jgi:hypothetical protein